MLIVKAVKLGHNEIAKWMQTRPALCNRALNVAAVKYVARREGLAFVQWALASCDSSLAPDIALAQASIYQQQHVMDWIYNERLAASGIVAIKCIMPRYDVDTLKWLHTKYPQRKIDWKALLVAMKNVTGKYDLDVLA